MTNEEKAWAVADAFEAMRQQRKARKKAEGTVLSYWIDRATEADKDAVDAVDRMLRAIGR